MPGQGDDLVVKLIKNEGWYSVPLAFGAGSELILVALVNPAVSVSLITAGALDHLRRWELVDLGDHDTYLLRQMSIEGQGVPDFEVRLMPFTRVAYRWDIILGASFFEHYSDLHLNLPTLVARLIDP